MRLQIEYNSREILKRILRKKRNIINVQWGVELMAMGQFISENMCTVEIIYPSHKQAYLAGHGFARNPLIYSVEIDSARLKLK